MSVISAGLINECYIYPHVIHCSYILYIRLKPIINLIGSIVIHIYGLAVFIYILKPVSYLHHNIFNPRHECTARVTVLGLCVCLSVCPSDALFLRHRNLTP